MTVNCWSSCRMAVSRRWTEATRLAAGTALSGPAGGVAAAVALTRNGLAPEHHRLRHGRHIDRHRRGARWAADLVGRQVGRQCPDRAAQPGHRHAGRRRRIDRQAGPVRPAGSGSRKRRRRSRASLLWPGRHRGDRDRRQSGAGLPRSRQFPGRPAQPGPGCGDGGRGDARGGR